jgi:hypothetical protein
MNWRHIDDGDATRIRWDFIREAQCAVDPYLVWANASDYKGFETTPKASLYQVAVEYRRDKQEALGDGLRCITALDGDTQLAVGEVDLERLKHLLASKDVAALEFGMVVKGAPQEVDTPDPGNVPGPVVAVVDFGCAFAHCNFRTKKASADEWESRIEYLWDQDRSRSPTGRWRAVEK